MKHDLLLRLRSSIKELKAAVQISAAPTLDDLGDDQGVDAEELFQQVTGYDCPETLKSGLYVPDRIAVNWRATDKIAGDIDLSSTFLMVSRTLSPGMEPPEINGNRLQDPRIVDEAVVQSDPITTLCETKGGHLTEALYVYNLRELFRLELNYQQYLEQLVITKGIVRWQYLFCRGMKITGFEKASLKLELDYLKSSFPAHDYSDLYARWEERTQS